MENLIKRVNDHRTIREFTDQKVSEENLNIIFDSIMRTATSTGMQMASIIHVTDPEKKLEISKVCNQEYVARAPELLIFIVDNYRNNRIIKDTGQIVDRESDVDTFFQGYSDAILMAQNAMNIIESMGMGAVYLGSILNNPEKIIEILNLPPLTFPVLGIGFGYPNQEPQLKPRLDKKYRIFENEYKIFNDYSEELKDYDQEMTSYYDLREGNKRSDSFFNQVVSKAKNPIPNRLMLIEFARKNGFKL
ncbi:MAG: NADPH-dependent oxidoreductase [Tissierellia bacterium]|nr:NADPH-dependent oxidoreductase [Tissierellia bacterium]